MVRLAQNQMKLRQQEVQFRQALALKHKNHELRKLKEERRSVRELERQNSLKDELYPSFILFLYFLFFSITFSSLYFRSFSFAFVSLHSRFRFLLFFVLSLSLSLSLCYYCLIKHRHNKKLLEDEYHKMIILHVRFWLLLINYYY